MGKLSARFIATETKPGRYGDGDGLYLNVDPGGAKSWIFRYQRNGRATHMGLGALRILPLADARIKALALRRTLLDGCDPMMERRAEKLAKLRNAATAVTFADAARHYITAHKIAWRNEKHRAQWKSTLATYAEPIFGDLPIADVDTGLVLKALEPIWSEKPETASRLRGRIESILDWAKVRGYREGENPARWRGHLDKILPARAKVRKVEHHAALPYGAIPGFMTKVRAQQGIAARALEFTILTAARTGEALGARWSEIDLAARIWTIPSERMKSARPHRVPLSNEAVAAIESLRVVCEGGIVFPGARSGRPMSNTAMLMTLRRMGRGDLTTHGFRSSFRDWAAEKTACSNEVVEMALAHAVGDKVEAAYRRGDLFDKRRRLMDAWGEFCAVEEVAS